MSLVRITPKNRGYFFFIEVLVQLKSGRVCSVKTPCVDLSSPVSVNDQICTGVLKRLTGTLR